LYGLLRPLVSWDKEHNRLVVGGIITHPVTEEAVKRGEWITRGPPNVSEPMNRLIFLRRVDDISLSADNPFVVPESQAERSGIRRGQVKMSNLLGGGFPANVEVLHQLHCLVRLLQWHLGDPVFPLA
jgi:hypothetical protein